MIVGKFQDEDAEKGIDAAPPKPPKRQKSRKKAGRIGDAVAYIIYITIWLSVIVPMAGILIASFLCTGTDPAVGTTVIRLGFDNYVRIFRETLFLKWYGNTLLIGVVTAIAQTAFQLLIGYVFSRVPFKGKRVWMGIILWISMLPSYIILAEVNIWMNRWGLTGVNAPYGAIIVYTVNSGMGFIVVKNFFDSIDRSVTEAAELDGANRLQIFFRIFLPTARPIMIYTMFTGFLAPWSNFSVVDAVLPGYTVADGLVWILSEQVQDSIQTFCAGGVVTSVPLVILFLLLRKYYVAGEAIRTTGKPPCPTE